jgi:hypothetical protein
VFARAALIQEPERAHPAGVETIDGIGIYRVAGAGRLDQAIEAVSGAVLQARESGVERLMVVVPDSGLAAPSPAEILRMVRHWAELAGGRMRLAVVSPASMMDPERLGVVAAHAFGLAGESFVHEDEALAWLREGR